ncbi:MAG: tetratricopeptide repeat protein [Bacteroidetes bacterium]|nr:tetratricopeptide repeat protein [Bacteroidota bacterium]
MLRLLVLLMITPVFFPASAWGQSYRATVNKGNEFYHSGQYDEARNEYLQAGDTAPDRPESFFNAGNAAYRNDDIKAALELYEQAGVRVKDREMLSRTLYNAGNTFLHAAETGAENPLLKEAAGEQAGDLRQEGYKQAIEMYKKTLKLNPQDDDARYNLTYARKKLEELQNEDQDQKKDDQDQQQQQQQDKEKDQEQKDKDKQDDQQKQDQQDQQQQEQQQQQGQDQKEKGRQDEQEQAQPQKEPSISKQQAEQILRALQREEKELQRKKRQQQGRRVEVERDW